MKKNMLFVLNPTAGKTHIKGELFEVINAFSDAGYRVTVYPTRQPFDGKNIVISEGADYDRCFYRSILFYQSAGQECIRPRCLYHEQYPQPE